jgi:predicted Zn-ribbon and HTH transcriptional regulator
MIYWILGGCIAAAAIYLLWPRSLWCPQCGSYKTMPDSVPMYHRCIDCKLEWDEANRDRYVTIRLGG